MSNIEAQANLYLMDKINMRDFIVELCKELLSWNDFKYFKSLHAICKNTPKYEHEGLCITLATAIGNGVLSDTLRELYGEMEEQK